MGTQLPLPGYWPRNATWSDPRDELKQLECDKLNAKVEIRDVLERYARHHGVELDEVTRLVRGYVDDLVNDLFFEKEDEIRDGIIERDDDADGGP